MSAACGRHRRGGTSPARRRRDRARGFVLPVALLLLATLVVVALSDMATAAVELLMAGHEQGRVEAQSAALAGIEIAVARIASGGVTSVPGSSDTLSGPVAAESRARYDASVRVAGLQPGALDSGGVRFDIVHYEITSRGIASRKVLDVQVQGVAIVRPSSSEGTSTSPTRACFDGATLLPRCVRPGAPVRTFWRSTGIR